MPACPGYPQAAEDCLLFPTGFAANLSVMTSLTATLAAPAPQPPTATTTPPPQPPALAAGGSAVTRAYGSKGGGGPGGGDVAIFSDELNHASIIDGARLASRGSAKLFIYRHNDLDHLEVHGVSYDMPSIQALLWNVLSKTGPACLGRSSSCYYLVR